MNYSFGHIGVAVKDLERSLAFYCGTLGFKKCYSMRKDDGDIWLQFVEIAPGQHLELFPGEDVHQYKDMGLKHIAIMVDDLSALIADLGSRGAYLYAGPAGATEMKTPIEVPQNTRCHSYSGWTKDPDGNLIEFMQLTPDSLMVHPEQW